MTKALQLKLRAVLDAEPSTADFVQDVIAVIEALYADDDDGCPEAFEALDRARDLFEAHESDDEDDEEEE